MILTEKELFKLFPKKELLKTNQKEFRIQKIISDKLYLKWKGSNNSFYGLIDKNSVNE